MQMGTLALVAFFSLSLAATATASDDAELRRDAEALFGRLEGPAPAALSSPEVELGRLLFWEPQLSLDGQTSCGSCHAARDWGSDRAQFSFDARWTLTSRHSQTVFNSMKQSTIRWLGDRRDGAHQAEGSLTGSLGFASKELAQAAIEKLAYADKFKIAYPADAKPATPLNYGKAIMAYQATLVTPAPFDRFLAGDDAALTAQQKQGLRSFIEVGCGSCHSGALLGGMMFQRFGLQKEYWKETGSEKVDAGRFAVTKNEEDKYVFRVPMLRNIAKTAPYFHDGSVAELGRAVQVMASVQLDRTLDGPETAAIVAFLESLTGEVPAHYAPPGKMPALD